jgi:uracil phosphoribosyltransferase
MAKVHIMDHPLVHHKLAVLRNKDTSVKEFRELINEIAGLMCYEATRDLPLMEVEVETPVAVATGVSTSTSTVGRFRVAS